MLFTLGDFRVEEQRRFVEAIRESIQREAFVGIVTRFKPEWPECRSGSRGAFAAIQARFGEAILGSLPLMTACPSHI